MLDMANALNAINVLNVLSMLSMLNTVSMPNGIGMLIFSACYISH